MELPVIIKTSPGSVCFGVSQEAVKIAGTQGNEEWHSRAAQKEGGTVPSPLDFYL